MPTFADSVCHVVSVTDPYGRILGFSRPGRNFFFQIEEIINGNQKICRRKENRGNNNGKEGRREIQKQENNRNTIVRKESKLRNSNKMKAKRKEQKN
jgi:hypothetical protein